MTMYELVAVVALAISVVQAWLVWLMFRDLNKAWLELHRIWGQIDDLWPAIRSKETKP